jgi:transposase
VAVESLGLNRWFVNGCRAAGLDVVVVHAASLKLKESGKKTDRRDAREISRRLWLGDLDRVGRTYYPTDAEYDTRRVIRMRHKLLRQRQILVNQIRSLFVAYKEPCLSAPLYGKRKLKELGTLIEKLPAGAAAARCALAVLRTVQEQIQVLDREIAVRAEKNAQAQKLVREVPQVAALTSLVVVSELGAVDRFRGTREVASYPGLVPQVYDSGPTVRHGRLTKRGNRELRWILGQLAVRLLTFDRRVKRWASRQRMEKNRIRTALARRLLIGMYLCLRDGRGFSLERCLSL